MENNLSISFERTLYQAVIRYKLEHPGALEARTRQRKEQAQHRRPNGTVIKNGKVIV